MYGKAVYGYLRHIVLQGKGIPENERVHEKNRQPGFAYSFYGNGIAQTGQVRVE